MLWLQSGASFHNSLAINFARQNLSSQLSAFSSHLSQLSALSALSSQLSAFSSQLSALSSQRSQLSALSSQLSGPSSQLSALAWILQRSALVIWTALCAWILQRSALVIWNAKVVAQAYKSPEIYKSQFDQDQVCMHASLSRAQLDLSTGELPSKSEYIHEYVLVNIFRANIHTTNPYIQELLFHPSSAHAFYACTVALKLGGRQFVSIDFRPLNLNEYIQFRI